MNCIVIVEKNDNKIENSSLECISIANKISENVIVITDIDDEKIIKSQLKINNINNARS